MAFVANLGAIHFTIPATAVTPRLSPKMSHASTAVTGGTTMHVTITSPGGGLSDRADEITVTAVMPAQGVGPIDIDTTVAGPNHVTTNDADFPIPGVWEVTVTARYGEFDQVVFTGELEVRQR